jgi:hypothetical protein
VRCDNVVVMADDDTTDGSAAEANDRGDPPHETAPTRRKLRLLGAFARLTATQIWVAMIAVVVGSVLTLVIGHLLAHPTAADQLEQFEQQQGAEGYTPVRQLVGDLRGDGTKSYVFVMRSDAVAQLAASRGSHSDRVIVLDDDHGSVHVVFSFQPSGSVLSAGEIRKATKGLSPGQARQSAKALARPNPYVARLDSLMDVDGAGRLEVVGSWNDFAMQAVDPRPFEIAWDSARQRYVMSSLLKNALEAQRSIARVRNPGLVGRILRPRYVQAQTLRDIRTGTAFRSLVVDDYALAIRGGHLVLVAAYVVRGMDFADEQLWQIIPYRLYQTAADPALFDCARRNLFMGPPRPPSFSIAGDALATWRASADTAGC